MWSWWIVISILTAVIAIQWFMLSVLLFQKALGDDQYRRFSGVIPLPPSSLQQQQQEDELHISSTSSRSLDRIKSSSLLPDAPPVVWKGVAVTLALSAPKWFHRRYTVMIQNVLWNTPDDWAVQIIANGPWWEKEIMQLQHHRNGMGRLLQHPRVILTVLPNELLQYKPKQVMTTMWFWQQLVADRVLMFSGNGAFCANSHIKITDLNASIDYMGVPTSSRKKTSHHDHGGGDVSTHSVRNRPAMLAVLQDYHATAGTAASDVNKPMELHGSEGDFFVSHMHKLNKVTPNRFRLATHDESVMFGGTWSLLKEGEDVDEEGGSSNNSNVTIQRSLLRDDYETIGPPFVFSGTQANLPYDVREALLNICPEVKVIFPSLHEPNCFGAHPQPEKCAASICALRKPLPGSGC